MKSYSDRNLNLIWRVGREAAICGRFIVDDCPYVDATRKRAWTLGFMAGLEIARAESRMNGKK